MKYSNILIVIFLIFFIVEITSQFTFNAIGDDYVYFYMGKQVAEGYYPYTDFFYAHPPLQLILYGFLFMFIPFNSHTFHILFILLTIVNSYLLYSIIKKEFNERIALISSTIGLFAPTMLYNASFEYGLTMGMFFFLLGLKWENKPILQGFLFLCASFYRFHLIFFIMGYYIYNLIIQEWQYLKRMVWFVNWFVFINGFLSLTIYNYFQDVFLYHLYKPSANIGTFLTISTILKINWLLFLLPLVLVLFYIKECDIKIAKYLFIPIPFLLLLTKSAWFGYYFVLIIPFLAVISAYTITKIEISEFPDLNIHYNSLIFIAVGFFVGLSAFNYATIKSDIPDFNIQNQEIVGDAPITSYLSLTKGNRVMDNEIDTNSMIYENGIKNITYLTTKIMISHPLVIVKKDEGIYARNKEFRDYVGSCKLIQEIKNYKIFTC